MQNFWNYLPKLTLRTTLVMLTVALLGTAATSHAQQGLAALKPPPGSHVAIFEFADLECPMCARENQLLKDAAAKYHVPWLRHDFPLPQHIWSFQAAVNARWFDSQPKHLGNDYRDAVFANQNSIETVSDLSQFTSKFANQHGVAFPFAVDPQGTISNAIKADVALAQSIGVHQTPTVWIVTDKTGGAAPYVEVKDFSKLYTMLDEAVATTGHSKK